MANTIIAPATVTLVSVATQHLTAGSSARDTIRPLGATLIAFGVLGAVSAKAPNLVNMFAWTIAGTAAVTLGLPVVNKYFTEGK